MLLSLEDGTEKGHTSLGHDLVATAVSEDGQAAYVSDNSGGSVYAVHLPDLRTRWQALVGGAPGPLLAAAGSLWVSLYGSNQVVELDPATGQVRRRHDVGSGPGQLALLGGTVWVGCSDGTIWDLAGHHGAGGRGFGLVSMPSGLWSADYDGGALIHVADGRRVELPTGLHPFWLSAAPGSVLVAAEGRDEDRDPGAVFALDEKTLELRKLDSPRDPDAAVFSDRVYIAAHGERQVRVAQLDGSRPPGVWANSTSAVAIAVDPVLALLVVVTNAHE